jgi:hypothetical protein
MPAVSVHLKPAIFVNAAELPTRFAQLIEGRCFQIDDDSGKVFKKMAGLLLAPDTDAYNWIKARVSANFFNTYVVRIVYVSASCGGTRERRE